MRIPNQLLADRRVVLLALCIILAAVLGFITFTADQSLRLVIYGGYWAMLVLATWFIFSLSVLWRRSSWRPFAAWDQGPRWPVLLILVSGLVLLAHERYGFKILMDEPMLLGTSMTMHFEKVALVPMRGNDIHGAFQLLNGELDKRPLFQPFLTSVLHDLTGYRPENVFVLNTALTFVLLGLGYHVGRRIGGRPAGALVVLLLTGLPLLAQNATGAGFELLNLVMITATLALGMRFAEQRDSASQQALILSAVLLAHTRYESVLFLLPVAALILWVWWQERRPILNFAAVVSPLLLLPSLLHHQVFRSRTSAWELASQPGFEHPFSLSYIPDNIAHALAFFFNTDGQQSNSLAIAALGFVAAPFFLLSCAKILRAARAADPARLALAFFAIGFLAHTALLMCYFWGKFDDPVIRRLSLPLNLGLVLAIVAAAADFASRRVWLGLAVIGMVAFFGHSLPAMARHDYTLDYYAGREAEWKRDFIAAHPERDYLVIDNSSIFWITHLVSSTPMLQARERKEIMEFNLRNRTFTAMYVFQTFTVDPDNGRLTVLKEDALGPEYQLERVWERRFTIERLSRISRITAINLGQPPLAEAATPPPALDRMTADEREKVRKAYFERFIQKLP